MSEIRWEPWIRWMLNSPRCTNEVIQTWGGCGESSNQSQVKAATEQLSVVLWISGTAAVAVRTFLIYSLTAATLRWARAGRAQTLERNNHTTENWRKFVCRPSHWEIGLSQVERVKIIWQKSWGQREEEETLRQEQIKRGKEKKLCKEENANTKVSDKFFFIIESSNCKVCRW